MEVALLIVVALVAAYGAIALRGLVTLRRQTQHAFGQIDLQLKRRCEAVPKLVDAVKGDLGTEHEALEKLMQARSQALSAKTVVGKAAAENSLHRAIDAVFTLAQTHPDLEVDADLMSLLEAFRTTQNKIAFASQYYNDVATNYNLRLESFPSNVFASIAKFGPIDLFELEGIVQREPVKARI
jgi:LemA protein